MLNTQIIIIIMDLILYFVPKHEESEAAEFTNQAHDDKKELLKLAHTCMRSLFFRYSTMRIQTC
jgi:hypothetical protein